MVIGPGCRGLCRGRGPRRRISCAAGVRPGGGASVGSFPAAVGPPTWRSRRRAADALAGVRLIRSSPPLLGAISLDLMAVLFGGATALMPVFARDILHVGAFGNGLLRAAPGVGAVMVGVVLTVRPLRRRVGRPPCSRWSRPTGRSRSSSGCRRNFALSLCALAALAGADMISMLLRGTLVRCSARRPCAAG